MYQVYLLRLCICAGAVLWCICDQYLKFGSVANGMWLREAVLTLSLASSSPDQGGASFWVTLHYEQKHPEFLLNPREFAQLNMRWKPNTRIQMFWKNEDHPQGGEYVPHNTLVALEHHALFGCHSVSAGIL